MTAGRLTDLERPAHPRTRSDHPRCPLHLRRLLLDPTAVRVCIHAYTPEPSGVPGLRMPVQPPGVRTDALTHSVRAQIVPQGMQPNPENQWLRAAQPRPPAVPQVQ